MLNHLISVVSALIVLAVAIQMCQGLGESFGQLEDAFAHRTATYASVE